MEKSVIFFSPTVVWLVKNCLAGGGEGVYPQASSQPTASRLAQPVLMIKIPSFALEYQRNTTSILGIYLHAVPFFFGVLQAEILIWNPSGWLIFPQHIFKTLESTFLSFFPWRILRFFLAGWSFKHYFLFYPPPRRGMGESNVEFWGELVGCLPAETIEYTYPR